MFCSSRRKSPGLSTELMQAFIFPDILIIYENKNKTALLACQMEIFFKEENGKKLVVAKPENPTLLFRICLFGFKKAGRD